MKKLVDFYHKIKLIILYKFIQLNYYNSDCIRLNYFTIKIRLKNALENLYGTNISISNESTIISYSPYTVVIYVSQVMLVRVKTQFSTASYKDKVVIHIAKGNTAKVYYFYNNNTVKSLVDKMVKVITKNVVL